MRITTTRHDYEWIEQQVHGLKYEILSSGVSSEELSILLLPSVLGYRGLHRFPRPCKLLRSPPFSLLLSFSWSLLLGGSLTLYTSFQSILTLHLLIIQVITRVLILSATFPNLLWVAATKAALFRGHFLINVARTLVGCIQCEGDSFSLDCSCTIRPWVSYCTCPSPRGALGGCLCRRVVLSSWDLGCREQDHPRQRFYAIWAFFVCPQPFFPPRLGLGLSIKWAGVVKFFGPTILMSFLYYFKWSGKK